MTQQEKEERIALYAAYYGVPLRATELLKQETVIEDEYLKFCPNGCDPIIGPVIEQEI